MLIQKLAKIEFKMVIIERMKLSFEDEAMQARVQMW